MESDGKYLTRGYLNGGKRKEVVYLLMGQSKRNCYCNLWESHPEVLEHQGLPRGYCGICDTCGIPGHMRHAPGGAPYTGAWCDRCYRKEAIKNLSKWVAIILVISLIIYAAKYFLT